MYKCIEKIVFDFKNWFGGILDLIVKEVESEGKVIGM